MSKVVCRIQKISSMSKIGKAGSHNFRKQSEANRDHTNNKKNEILIGSDDLVSDVKNRLNDAEKNSNGKFRSNAVLAVEMILSASPDYFKDRKALDKWVSKNMDWIKKDYGSNCVNAVLHLDEQTPHIHLFIVPVDKKNKLNCREFFGGKEKMKLLQDSSFLAVKELGIQRGTPKEITAATHKTIKRWRKEQLENDTEKHSFQKSIEKIPELETNFTGLVKASTADQYYKKCAVQAVAKTYVPKLIKTMQDSRKTMLENSSLKKENLALKKKEIEMEDERKSVQKRNFELSQSINLAMEQGYKQRVQEEEEEARKAHQRQIQKQQQNPSLESPSLKNPTPKPQLKI